MNITMSHLDLVISYHACAWIFIITFIELSFLHISDKLLEIFILYFYHTN